MKTFNNIIIKSVMIASSLALASCGGSDGPLDKPVVDPAAKGTFEIQMSAQNKYIITGAGQTKTENNDNIEVKNFTVIVKNSQNEAIKAWSKFSEVEPVVTLEQGTYMLEAFSTEMVDEAGERLNAAWDMPYYYGSKEFLVMPQATAEVAVECKLANIKTSVNFSEIFLAEMENARVQITNNEENPEYAGALIWTPGETRDGFFRVPETTKSLMVIVSGTSKVTGTPTNIAITLNDVQARQWHKITIDLAPSSGGARVTMTINNELVEEEHIIEVPDDNDIIGNGGDNGIWNPDGGEDPNPNPDPTPELPLIVGKNLNGNPFDLATAVKFTVGDESAKTLDVLLSSTANGGIKNLFVTIESANPGLSFLINTPMDIANPAAEQWVTLFQEVGIIDPNNPILGKTEHLFSIGGLMSLLGGLSVDGDEHRFIIRVVDANGESNATLTIQYVTQ